ncbi:hypothetical protein V6Z11_A02G153600 [Gossypium hirsutum]
MNLLSRRPFSSSGLNSYERSTTNFPSLILSIK